MTDDAPDQSPLPAGYRPAVFLVSLATLALQVALVRVLSVSLWYHFAFVVVSMAVLGYGLSGMVLTSWPGLLERQPERRLALLAAGCALSTLVCLFGVAWIPFDPFRMLADPVQLVFAALYFAVLLLPFSMAGLCVGGILTTRHADASRLYALDLVGAAVGCTAVVLAFRPLGGEGTVAASAVVAALAAVVLGRPLGGRAFAASLGLLGITVVVAASAAQLAPVRVTADKVAGAGVTMEAFLEDSRHHRLSEWNALSRVDVVEVNGRRLALLDGGVAQVRFPHPRGPISELPPTSDVTAVAYPLVDSPSVLVLGSGAGWEVLAALSHGASEVTAVEVNPTLNRLVRGEMREWVGGLFDDPRVELVTDEARSFLRRSSRKWDIIVGAHTISNAATASGALSLAESHLLTVEAVEDYLAHVSDSGAVYLTRPEAQLPKLAATFCAVFWARGVDCASRVAVLRTRPEPGETSSFTAGLIASSTPLDPERVARLRAAVERAGAEVLWLPGGPGALADAVASREPDPAAIEPATDDRPFFGRRRSWSSLRLADFADVLTQGERGRLALEDRPIAEVSLAALLVQSVLLAGLFTFVPLWWRRRRSPLPLRGRGPVVAYFALLGLGFMFVELGLVHRLGLFIGSPTLTFAVAVGGLLLTSGLGARLCAGMSPERRMVLVVACAAAAVLGVGLGAPLLTRAALGLPAALRAVIAVVLLAPAGLALGMPFPLGLRRAGASQRDLLALVWAVNGFASVIASVASLVVATGAGFTAVLLCGAACYAGAAGAARLWPKPRPV